jgi:Leucine-rich repeat (LRR) protein
MLPLSDGHEVLMLRPATTARSVLRLSICLLSFVFCRCAAAQCYETLDDLHHGSKTHKVVDLSNKGLSGIPDYVLNDPSIELLDLSRNKIKTLPHGLYKMKGLRALILEENPVTSLPDDLSQLTALQYLNLNYSKFSELPVGIYTIPNLTELTLFLSKIQRVPKGLSRLKHLKCIQLGQSSIKNFDSEFPVLPQLKQLELYMTQLVAIPDLALFPSLEILDLRNDPIEEIPNSVGSLHFLRELILAGTNIHILPPTLGQVTTLTDLDLGYMNQLESLPKGLGVLGSLQSLKISRTRLQGLPEDLRAGPFAKTLDISENKSLYALPEHLFDGAQRLEEIDIHGNHLSELPQSLSQPSALRRLNVAGNLLTSIPDIVTLNRLEEVTFDGNRLTSIPCQLFTNKSIKVISLSQNMISVLPDCVKASEAEAIILSRNQIHSIPLPQIASSQVKRLYVLDNPLPQDQLLSLVGIGIQVQEEPGPPAGASVGARPNADNLAARWQAEREKEQQAEDAAASAALLKTISVILARNPKLRISIADYETTENRLVAGSLKTRTESRRAFLRLLASKVGAE